MIRNPDISERISQHLLKIRSTIRETSIRGWFPEINMYFLENNLMEIIKDPKRIYNCDETPFLLAPKENCVLVAKGEKSVCNVTNNDDKECLTTLIMVNAIGDNLPPMVVYKYKRIPFSLARKMPKGWGMGCSDSGWMNGEIFFEYIANVFLPYLRQNQAEFPVVLFLDGHVSHLSLALSEFCKEYQIILIAPYPNATHLLQPLDVGVFRPLKVEWKKAVHSWKIENDGRKLRKEDFAPLLERILPTAANQTSIQNAFRVCGIYPFSANAVNYSKLIKNPETIVSTSIPKIDIETRPANFLQIFESLLSQSQLQSFKDASESWNGIKEDENLYYMWVNLRSVASVDEVQPNNSNLAIGEKTLDNIDFNEVFKMYDGDLRENIDGIGEVITLSIDNSIDIREKGQEIAGNMNLLRVQKLYKKTSGQMYQLGRMFLKILNLLKVRKVLR